MIFLMSFWVRAHVAANRVERAPKHKHKERAVGLLLKRGWVRMSRKIPATTMVLEWSRADTGVGPSIAAGSQGCKPNWADLPAAARIRPSSGRVGIWVWEEICWISHVFIVEASHAMHRISPTSPTRLYSTACKAAVLASARPCHQLISRKDMIPTPSHPIKSRKRLLETIKMSIAIRNRRRKVKNFVIWGSEAIYHVANCRIDQETNRAIGKKVSE